ncbi:response regulator transcription factor [Paenibacillus wynnii]|uniref:response regulator transcription factor n=1 Tax=Paenibacillus wynnii TaxID=268407 RepID=UPI0027926560|nr:response regulator [Paenibacillus wynnii]MDQ0194489.1 two-component system response regulator YesN [Paenibacillus wynnii]
MYRVLIVDDEPVIRNGISAFIDWEEEGMTVEDHYANGVEALSALESCSFDILITDIKMPLMDGIQLMKQALALCPSLKVILISNYSDFEYVKEGLKLGAVDYLLKLTLKREELLAVLRRTISMLEEERRRDSELNHYQEGALYLDRKRFEQEIKRYIVQEQTFPESTVWDPAWLEESYACVYLMLDAAEEWRENYGYLYVQLLLEELQEAFYKQMREGSALLVAESSLFIIFPDLEGEVEQQLNQWKLQLEAKWGISTSIGFAKEQGVHRILKGYAESSLACQRRFFEGLGGLYRRSESESNHVQTLTDIEPNPDWTPFFEMIHKGDPASSAIDFALERWKSGILNPGQVQLEASRLLTGVYQSHADAGALVSERYELLFRKTETLEQLASFMISELEEMGKPYIPKLSDNGYGGQLITKALEYIANHFTENLTLQSVADIVHLSKSYFSLLFKKQTERNFIDYLIELRIREAKRLLAQNDSRIYDVAGAAGFKDVKYFSKVFKKITGLTPVEYRESMK